MTQVYLPLWALIAFPIGTILASLLAAMYGPILLRKTGVETRDASRELDTWRKREETMRMIRWASEQVTSGDDMKARMGVGVLTALSDGKLIQQEDRGMVTAVVQAMVEPAIDQYDEGDDFEEEE